MSNRSIHTLLKNWDEECPLTREEAVEVLSLPEEEMDSLMECAYALRTKYKGKKVSVQLLTNVRSGNCTQNCAYCAQSKDSQAEIEKYKRVSDEKLYGDNDLVDEKHLARNCIGLRSCRPYPRDEEERHTDLLLHRLPDREAGKNPERCRTGPYQP